MIESPYNLKPLELIAHAMLSNCYNSAAGELHIDHYLHEEGFFGKQNKIASYLRLSLSAFRLAAGIISLREKYGEKAEPIVRQIYNSFAEISFSGDSADVGMMLTSLCKWYTANWSRIPPENEILPMEGNEATRPLLAEFLLEPLSEFENEIKISDALCTLIYRNLILAKGAVAVITMEMERDLGFIPSF